MHIFAIRTTIPYIGMNTSKITRMSDCPAKQLPRGAYEAGNIGGTIHEVFLVRSKFEHFSNSFICKNERITFNGAKFKMKLPKDIQKEFARGSADVFIREVSE